MRRTHTLPDFPQVPPPPPSQGPGSDDDLGELAAYPLRHSSAICKKTGGGRWYPKKTNTIEGYRMPGCKAQFEIDMEREEEELRRLKLNPVFKDGGECPGFLTPAFFAFLILLHQISSIVCPVRSNPNPSEVLVLLCFPLSDCYLAIDVSRSLTLPLGYLVAPRLYRTYALHSRPFLSILIDVLFHSNTHPYMYLSCTTIPAIPVFIYRFDLPPSARSVKLPVSQAVMSSIL